MPKMTKVEEIIAQSTLGQYAQCKEWNEELSQALSSAGLIRGEVDWEKLLDIVYDRIYRNCDMQMHVDIEGSTRDISKTLKSAIESGSIFRKDKAMSEEMKLKLCPLKYKIDVHEGCWLWTGAKNNRGYGHLVLDGKHMLAHRVSYMLFKGRIPKGLTVNHDCQITSCVNPVHLSVMTQKENNLLGRSPVAINKRKSICVNGHSLSGEHIQIQVKKDGTRRRCRLCERIYKKKKT